MNFLRSPIFLFIVIGLIIFAAASIHGTSNYTEEYSSYPPASNSAHEAVMNHFLLAQQHSEECLQYLAPTLEKYYLQRNISRKKAYTFMQDWWQKYPVEVFNIDWDNIEQTDLGNGKTQFRIYYNYCKGKNSYDLKCQDIFSVIKVNEQNQIYYMGDK